MAADNDGETQHSKKLRLSDDDDGAEALLRLRAAVQSAISSVAQNLQAEVLDEGTLNSSSSSSAQLQPNGELGLNASVAAVSSASPFGMVQRDGMISAGAMNTPPIPGMGGFLPQTSFGASFQNGAGCMQAAPLLPICLPPADASMMNFCCRNGVSNIQAIPLPSCIPPGNAAMVKKSCIPPGNAAMMKKRLANDGQDVDYTLQANSSSLSSIEALPPSHMPLQYNAGQHEQQLLMSQQHQLMAAASVSQGTSQLSLPPNLIEQQPWAAQVHMLAQQAEESAQSASSAAALCVSFQDVEPSQVETLVQTANQAAQRAAWALNFLESYITQDKNGGDDWVANMRHIVRKATETADSSARTCRDIYNDAKNKATEAQREDKWSTVSPIPCKWFVTSSCRNGDKCKYSHVVEPRPLERKTPVECRYFAGGQCTRGAGCPFAHGPEELEEIQKVVQTLRTNKRIVGMQKSYGR